MKSLFYWAFSSLLFAVSAHVFVGNPFPFHGGDFIDKLIMPMNGDSSHHPGPGWEQQPFPCKGYHGNASQTEPSTTWWTGTDVTFQLFDSTNTSGSTMRSPGAAHSGGSCQISFSYDEGHTWIAIQSWEGNCVRVRRGQEGSITNEYDVNQNYTFTIPKDLRPADKVIVAWTWLNASGNREFYMSCFLVKLKSENAAASIPAGYPIMIANLRANPAIAPEQDEALQRCHTPGSVWIQYPSRYKGINPVIHAELPAGSVIQYLNFEDPENYCGSDNEKFVQALALNTSSVLNLNKTRAASSLTQNWVPMGVSRVTAGISVATQTNPLLAVSR